MSSRPSDILETVSFGLNVSQLAVVVCIGHAARAGFRPIYKAVPLSRHSYERFSPGNAIIVYSLLRETVDVHGLITTCIITQVLVV